MLARLTLLSACLILFSAGTAQAQAQFLGCDPVTNPCTEVAYGLGNSPAQGPFNDSVLPTRITLPEGDCGGQGNTFRYAGQMRVAEQDNCVVSSTNRCLVEIPVALNDSGFFNSNRQDIDLGALGLLGLSGSSFGEMDGNLGHREISGTCGVSGDDCALDSQCDAQNAGDVCRSTCFDDDTVACASHQDCVDAGLPANNCRTEIEWDGIGICSDQATGPCTADSDCPGGEVCRDGLFLIDSPDSCACCQSSSGTLCGALAARLEYPALNCPPSNPPINYTNGPDWKFEGGRGTKFEHETITVAGQQEGLCAGNPNRGCGALGDLRSGGLNGKCTIPGEPCGADPFDPANLALASPCDDVDFGGIEGDFCDLSEDGLRIFAGNNPDGTQDPTTCALAPLHLVGTPNVFCQVAFDIPEGDPQPGCRLFNVGIVSQPDIDCNGIDDTTEGRCTPTPLQQLPLPAPPDTICDDPARCPPCTQDSDCPSGNCINNGDLCPFIGEVDQLLDSNNDDIGDECQCGDGTGDGAITGLDIAAVALCANGAAPAEVCDPTIIDATGDNATTAEDIGGVVAVVNGVLQTDGLACIRNLDTTQ